MHKQSITAQSPLIISLPETIVAEISLKVLLRSALRGGAVSCNPLNLQCVIPAHTTVTIVDDLLDCELTSTKLHFVLHEQSHLTYRLKMLSVVADALAADDGMVVIHAQASVDCPIKPLVDEHAVLLSPTMVIDKTIHVTLAGAGAHAQVKVVCMGKKQRSFKFKTIQEHAVGNTSSFLEVKGVFDDQSMMRCDSLIKVPEAAQKVDAKQVNKNLLLSSQARAVSIPKLEVEANDVKCSHGAAVSALDADSLFYLQSRGMDLVQSKALLIEAFLN